MVELPKKFGDWFAARNWQVRPHQAAMLAAATEGKHTLLIAPTGAGKTMAGFCPSLVELAGRERTGLHTLYVSPLKALASDIARNLLIPVDEMGLPIRIETRSGDTASASRARQRVDPPDILLTTPESLLLLLSDDHAAKIFGQLRCVVIDEIHALAGTKRGDQLALCLSRLSALAPAARRVGLSATVAHPDRIPGLCRRRRAIDRGRGRCRPRYFAPAPAGAHPLVRPYGPGRRRNRAGTHKARRHDDRLRQHPRPGRADVPGDLEIQPG